jgi:SAM-dependent methyltransferase
MVVLMIARANLLQSRALFMSNEHNGWYNKIFSAAYDPFMSAVENNALSDRRRKLLSSIKGEVLELGCGTGINFQYYDSSAKVLALEPSDSMRAQAEAKLAESKYNAQIRTRPWLLEDEGLAAEVKLGSFDAVVCTLVLCTVPDPAATLARLKSLLKPDGKLFALEHVRAKSDAGKFLQNVMNPLWRHMAEGCQLNRDTRKAIETAGFRPVTQDEFDYGLPFITGAYALA